jgi:hypothetical protein
VIIEELQPLITVDLFSGAIPQSELPQISEERWPFLTRKGWADTRIAETPAGVRLENLHLRGLLVTAPVFNAA